MMISALRDSGSFRDPKGEVYHQDDKILRVVRPIGKHSYETFKQSGLMTSLIEKRWLVNTTELDICQYGFNDKETAYLLNHDKIDFISYPYEWSFALLKNAALFYLDLYLESLSQGLSLSDASAYNIQFQGVKPIYIDVLSFMPYVEGSYWYGHRQFCENFLAPLLMHAILGLSHNALFRGYPDGIPSIDFCSMLPWRYRLSLNMQMHFYMPTRYQKKNALKTPQKLKQRMSRYPLSLKAYQAMLVRLKTWIESLKPKKSISPWNDYSDDNSYQESEEQAKRQFIHDFVATLKPGLIYDFGCNLGEYAAVALKAGAGKVIGFDTCQLALEKAHEKAAKENINFLPLYMDLSNPSSSQGFAEKERQGLKHRAQVNALFALALVHHLRFSHNIPLKDIIAWLVDLAPCGVIEFVPKSDPTSKVMLSFKEDNFTDYDELNFRKCLSDQATIVNVKPVSTSGRTLYWYQR